MNAKFSTLFWMLVAIVAAFGLYMVKYRVQHIKRELAGVEKQIRQEQEALHIVKAEWAYLNRPERLQELANRHLKLAPMQGMQIVELADIPKAGEVVEPVQTAQAGGLVSASVSTGALALSPLTQLPDGLHDE